MKALIILSVCITVVSVALLSCGIFDFSKIPVMDRRVVSYQMIRDNGERPEYWNNNFIIDKDALESWFPHIFDNEQVKSKCNYFAISFGTSSTLIRYWVLSPAMVLYKIKPDNTGYCGANDDIVFHTMLVCDDTEEGNLKDKIDLNSIRSYTDENWDCRKEGKNVFF